MSGRNFSLTEHLSDFVDDQVSTGRHQNASEVVREALRRYEDDIEAERASIAVIEEVAARGMAAIARGDFISVEGTEDARKLMQKFNARAAKRAQERSRTAKAKRG
ncbi:type II toxin-antitoxin system ParD family antitoxin [Dongia sedimenti]|uniref:Type II toxin-antitoxin system ParD family antitoxin n=1 Tax=Dongia sedimenti TaxID=3064282 RepID=A0ABU0YWL2_9PROT|nr:type II toxin-antitoxin system ParD family antitoxin [Rhodospirillaceae bacterium R-7]